MPSEADFFPAGAVGSTVCGCSSWLSAHSVGGVLNARVQGCQPSRVTYPGDFVLSATSCSPPWSTQGVLAEPKPSTAWESAGTAHPDME